MGKLKKIAELIVDYYKSRYWHHEVTELGEDLIEIDFYEYSGPEICYVVGYVGKKIEINHLDEIKSDDPELYQKIMEVIEEPKAKRPYNASPDIRTEKGKDEYFSKLVSEINNRGTGEKRIDKLLAFFRMNNTQKDLVMFRRRHAKE